MRRTVLLARAAPALQTADAWIRLRSRREQVLIAFFGGFLLLTLFWFAVPRPLLAARSEALARIETYEAIKAQVRNAGPGAVGRAVLPDGPIEAALTAQAATFALTPGGVTREGDVVVVALANARYESVIPWLASLEGAGVEIVRVRMTRQPVAGMVDVELRVRTP